MHSQFIISCQFEIYFLAIFIYFIKTRKMYLMMKYREKITNSFSKKRLVAKD